MKIPFSWLSLYTDVATVTRARSIDAIAHIYSIQTAEIDGIESPWQDHDDIIIARVMSTEPHPNSDHLHIVRVSYGDDADIHTIVCGAANVPHTKYVVVALPWATLPGGMTIGRTQIRGIESDGMICSDDELWLAKERSGGILPGETLTSETILAKHIGSPLATLPLPIPGFGGIPAYTTLRDTIFEIDNKFITNRPDLFSVVGNAREWSAIFDVPLVPHIPDNIPEPPIETSQRVEIGTQKTSFSEVCVKIETSNVLSYHTLAFDNVTANISRVDGVTTLLAKCGIATKYDLVDITNWIMIEYGQPMHAFDADTLTGGLCVRQARDGETIVALNGKTYTLSTRDMVIADDARVLAIAGIIGGEYSAVSATTQRVIYESACFDAVAVRQTSQRLGIRTDASTRYEKSLDPTLAGRALARILDLLSLYQKNSRPCGIFHYLDTSRVHDITITCTKDFLDGKIGTDIPIERIEAILTKLGFTYIQENGIFSIRVPAWRATKDISIPEDIAEEVGRVYGYDSIPETPLTGTFSITPKNPSRTLKSQAINHLSGMGWYEVYEYSFSNETRDAKIGYTGTHDAIHVINAFSEECTVMRRDMLGGLLETVTKNIRANDTFGLYEIGKIFHNTQGTFYEVPKIAGVTVGMEIAAVRRILDGLLATLLPWHTVTVSQGIVTSEYGYLHPNKSATFRVHEHIIGVIGRIHPQVLSVYDLSESGAIFWEMDITSLLGLTTDAKTVYRELAKYPSVTRELNFVLPETIATGNIARMIEGIHPHIHTVSVVDIFRDAERIGADRKSVTFTFIITDPEKTVTDMEALAIQTTVIETLGRQGLVLRSE